MGSHDIKARDTPVLRFTWDHKSASDSVSLLYPMTMSSFPPSQLCLPLRSNCWRWLPVSCRLVQSQLQTPGRGQQNLSSAGSETPWKNLLAQFGNASAWTNTVPGQSDLTDVVVSCVVPLKLHRWWSWMGGEGRSSAKLEPGKHNYPYLPKTSLSPGPSCNQWWKWLRKVGSPRPVRKPELVPSCPEGQFHVFLFNRHPWTFTEDHTWFPETLAAEFLILAILLLRSNLCYSASPYSQ